MEIMDLVDIMNIGSLDSPHRKFVFMDLVDIMNIGSLDSPHRKFVFFKYGGKIKKPDANL